MPPETTPTGLLINGRWRRGGDRLTVRDKFTSAPLAEIESPTLSQVDEAIEGAAAALPEDLPVAARASVLRGAVERLRAWREDVIATYVGETGFTPADAAVELERTAQILELSAQEAERLTGEMVPLGSVAGHEHSLCYTMRVPVGVVAAVTPFNAPLSTVAHKVAPALAAGNPVVLKPAELTPLCAGLLVRALIDAGLPPGRMQLLTGPGRTVGDRIVRDPRVRYVTFTGSTEVGRQIRSVCGLARTHLELGSNSPTLLWRDADLDHALPLVVRAGYRKAGQVCTSVQRLLVHQDIADEVAERLTALVRALPYGDPRAEGTAVGPVINPAAADRARELIADAVAGGAAATAGGTSTGTVLAPTLLTDLDPASRLSSEEAFAPVVGLTRVAGLGEAVARANATPYGLQAGVFCRDLDVAFTFARELRMGGVIINDTSSVHPDPMPYGGVKDSGHGVEGPRYAVHDMTDNRTILVRHRPVTG